MITWRDSVTLSMVDTELLSLGNCNEKIKHKINLIGTNVSYICKITGRLKLSRTFSDPQRFLCPCKIKHVLRRPPPPSSRHRVIFLAIKHNLAQGMFCVSMPELPQPHSNLLTILTGQDHISKVVVFCQVSKSSTLPLIFAKYFIWKIKGATQTHKISLC